jgi:hypothetical protein
LLCFPTVPAILSSWPLTTIVSMVQVSTVRFRTGNLDFTQNMAVPLHDALRGLDAGLPMTLVTWQKSWTARSSQRVQRLCH